MTLPSSESGAGQVAKGTRLQSVARSAQVLLMVATAATPPRAQEVAVELGVPLPTLYHLLNTLRLEAFLIRDEGRRYHLGPSVGVLADAVPVALVLVRRHSAFGGPS